jgi:hypothetical protein
MEEQLDAFPIRNTEDLLAKYQVAVTTDDSRDWSERVSCGGFPPFAFQ